MHRLSHIEQSLKKKEPFLIKAGDTVRVHVRIREGEKERTQVFEGTVISRKGKSHRETITVRKVSFGIGVEKIFPLHSPTIEKIEVMRKGRVRRAKLYYLRGRKGRAARVEERRIKSAPSVTEPQTPAPAETGESVQPDEAETVQAERT